ncbi:hypothetical protein HYC85_006980 [Camellia sinensis]|uniref:Uncharacterized protein n=1 Tax=Camellia sinensis TaxID=4442 RepID=A0A7J7HQ43_CAMSI|nr:hypothetical protein HYC85_006980 [Camellia sinensis]
MDAGVPQATSGDDCYSLVERIDYMAKHSENLDLAKDRERDEDPTTTGKYIDSSCVVAHNGVDDDKASVFAGQNLLEFEDGDSPGELRNLELVVEDYLAESNECSSSMKTSENVYVEAGQINIVDLSEIERIRPTTDSGSSEREVADSAGNTALSSIEKIQSGDFDHKTLVNLKPVEDQDKVGNVVITEPTFGADGFSPVQQEEHVEDDLKTLFATPENNTNPGEEAVSSCEPEMDDLRMQEGSTIGNMKNGKLNHGESQLVIGLTENEDEKMTYKENASPTANEEKVTGEGPDESAYGEFTKVNGTAFEGFVSKESYVREDKQSESLNFSGNASEGGTTEKMLELVGNEFIAESHVVDASIDCQCSEAKIPHTAHFAPKYQGAQ